MLTVGIIGLPLSGKTSLYNAVTRSGVDLARHGAGDVHMGVVPAPDDRFDYLVAACRPKKATPATIEFTDDAARIEAADHAGRGHKFGADFLSGVREVDALALVVRAFEDAAVPPPENGLDPLRDAKRVLEELVLADLMAIETRLGKLDQVKQQKRASPAESAELQTLAKVRNSLDAGVPVTAIGLSAEEERGIRGYAFVSGKPLVIAANVGENTAPDAALLAPTKAFCDGHGIPLIALPAKIEMEIAQMPPEEEREFLEALGLSDSARNRLIRAAYASLGMISFFTIGSDEVRAWSIRRGTTALGAAEKIHTDLARGFIRAEVIPFDDIRASGGCWDEARAAGKMKVEGREYVVQDGNVVHVRFKV